MEFDIKSLKPTYRLTIGLPGRSNAIAIAKRLGLPDHIIQDSRTEIDPQELQADELLDEIQRQRELTRKSRAEAEKYRQESEALRKELLERLEGIEDERAAVLAQAQGEVDQHIRVLNEELDTLRRKLARNNEPIDDVEEVSKEMREIEEAYELPYEPVRSIFTGSESRPIQVGDTVSHRKLDTSGVVTALDGDEAEIQLGMLRVRTDIKDLQLAGEGEAQAVEKTSEKISRSGGAAVRPASPGTEINLRGQRADEALEALERYLDSAYLAGLPYVRIIHGKGTGKLRQVIREALNHNPNVKSYEAGRGNEGGEGVTVARLDV